ncbi:hypothetical protein F8388_012311 [Cannabis sativa]|uniref:Ycf2 N-terminal domain-containing protein n=1 Tax=Cannabis sativa TaxID=3483 RepID=A0A7J6ECY8_CANSA|nr:hypothetical protein F8388_012311 [Cannabis sativa]
MPNIQEGDATHLLWLPSSHRFPQQVLDTWGGPSASNTEEPHEDSECLWAISNETVAGIEISFKEKDTKYLEFPFVYYMDDPIRKDHDWELVV